MKILWLISLICATLALSACGGTDSSDSQSQADEIVWRNGEPHVIAHGGPVPKKLIVKDLRPGTGTALEKGSIGAFKFKSFDYRTGQEYENWWEQPFRTPFGEGDSLGAWETGLKGMRVGGRRVLYVPPKQAYTHVPVVYVIELAAVVGPKPSAQAGTVERVAPTGPKPSTAVPPGPPPTKLVVKVLKKGSGGRVRRGDRIGVRFVDVRYETKSVEDFWGDEPNGPAPYEFVLGQGEVRKGWEIVLPGKRLGTRLELLLPSRLAYGDGPMRYVVELIERERTSSDRGA